MVKRFNIFFMNKIVSYITSVGAAIFVLASCNEIQPVDNTAAKSNSFEVFASLDETKTSNDGLHTKWVANDGMNIFHAPSGESTFASDGEFVIDDAITGHASGELSEALESGNYDWVAVYPYNSYLESPANNSESPARFYIGCRSDDVQTQSGNSNMAHLAGSKFPLWGIAENVSSASTPSISMNQIASVIEFNVTNKLEKAITVTGVEFTAPEDIVGYFNIHFGNPISYDPYSTYHSSTANLTVSNGDAIAKDASATFYIGVKPFSAEANEVLNVKVTASTEDGEGVQERVITLTNATTFQAGKIKKINVDFAAEIEEEEEWEFVATDYELASSIDAGDEIIITSGKTGTVAAMGKYLGTTKNNWPQVSDVSVESNTITSTEDMAIITVGVTETGYTFFDNNSKYYWNATSTTSKNYLIGTSADDELDNYSYFTVSFGTDGNAVITNTGKSSRNIVRYNSSSSIFSCYSSGQGDVYIFKKAAPRVLSSIAISNVAREYFYVNEEFDYSGLIVTATYTNGKQSNVTGYSVSTPEMTTAGEKTVTVTYTENNVTKTADYTITVLELPILQSIELSGSYKTSFMQDEGFNTAGLVVTAKYQNGQSRDLSEREYSLSDIDTHNPGEQTVTISYTEDEVTATASYIITITERPVYTVTFAVEGIVDIVLPVYEIITLPVVENVPSPYSFVGWVESVLETETPQEPSNILSGQYTITKNVTLYPVYSKTVSGGVVWRKLEQFDGEGTYVIITNDGTKAFNGGLSSGHGQSTSGTFAFVDGVAKSVPTGALELIATAKGDGYELYNADKGYLIATKAGSGGLDFKSTTSDDCYWYFSTKFDKQRNMLYQANDARLRSYNNTTFRTYGGNNGDELYLAKKEAGESTIYTSSLSSE